MKYYSVRLGSLFFGYILIFHLSGFSQDSSENYIAKTVQLDEVVIKASRYDFNVAGFIKRIETDTSFFKAFKTLRIIGYSASHHIRVFDEHAAVKASFRATTRQIEDSGCRHLQILQQRSTGNFFTRGGNDRYYTAKLYASLFLDTNMVCGDDNIVNGGSDEMNMSSFSLEKHIRQLEMLVFNPGRRVPGVPIVGKKVAIFDPDIAPMYHFSISSADYQGSPCWVFDAKAKPEFSKDVVIDELKTYFDSSDYRIVYRSYSLAYKTWLFDFNVQMEVHLTEFNGNLVPQEILYQGNWGVPVNKRERVDFTIQLYDFNSGNEKPQ